MYFSAGFAQTSVDSLLLCLDTCSSKQSEINVFQELAGAAVQISFDSSIYYQKEAIETSKSIKNNSVQTINLMLDLHDIYSYCGRFNYATDIAKEASQIAKNANDKNLEALCLHKVGNIFYFKSENEQALEYYSKALEIRQDIHDTLGMAATTSNMGLIYLAAGLWDDAIVYFNRALEYDKALLNFEGVINSYLNIASIYHSKGEYDSAIIYIRNTFLYWSVNNDKHNLGMSYENMGVLYMEKKKNDAALMYLNKGLENYKSTKVAANIARCYNNIAGVYYNMENYDLALKYTDSSLLYTEKSDLKDQKITSYEAKSKIYSFQNKYDSAYKYLNLSTLYSDTISQDELHRKLADNEKKYEIHIMETEMKTKDLELEKKNLEIKSRRKSLLMLEIFISIFVILSIFLVIISLKNVKANKLLTSQNELINKQNKEKEHYIEKVEKTLNLVTEANVKLEQQKKLLNEKNEYIESSIRYASTVQNASLPLKEVISKYFDYWLIYYPKDIVSGDFYMCYARENQQNTKDLYFIVGDCTGHGVSGALMSMISMRLIDRAISELKLDSPAEILSTVEKEIVIALNQEKSDNKDGMDVVICKFSEAEAKNSYDVTFAGAKLDLVYYCQNDKEIKRIKGTRRSIGGAHYENMQEYENQIITMTKDNILFLYSDGILDQSNKARKKFGTKRLLKTLDTNINKPFAEQKDLLANSLSDWQGDSLQRDDITFVALKLKNGAI